MWPPQVDDELRVLCRKLQIRFGGFRNLDLHVSTRRRFTVTAFEGQGERAARVWEDGDEVGRVPAWSGSLRSQ